MVEFIDHAPKVFVIGASLPNADDFYPGLGDYLNHRGEFWKQGSPFGPQSIAEIAGRVCYQSWSNPAGRTTEEYLQEQIVGHGHGSVIEHLSVNLLVADLPRSSQLELVRHRAGMAYSFESTRFTDKHMRFIIPPRIREDDVATSLFKYQCTQAVEAYQDLIARALKDTDEGTLKRKRAKEAARSVLPNALGSDGLVTMNARAARHIIHTRTAEGADLSIREFAYEVYKILLPIWPAVFADAIEEPGERTPIVRLTAGKV